MALQQELSVLVFSQHLPPLPKAQQQPAWSLAVDKMGFRKIEWLPRMSKGGSKDHEAVPGSSLPIFSMILCLIRCAYRINNLMSRLPLIGATSDLVRPKLRGPKRSVGCWREVQLELFRKLLEPALAVIHNKRISASSCCDFDLPSGWTSLRFPRRHCDLCRDDVIGVHTDR
jgi:hypothetical protein